MELSLSLHSHGGNTKCRAGDVGLALASEGVRVVSASEEFDGPHAVLFNEVNASLFSLLATASRGCHGRVIALAADGDLLSGATPWQILNHGASEILVWDADQTTSAQVAARLRRWHKIDSLVNSELVRRNTVGRSRAWLTCLRRVVETAVYGAGPVLLTGESGTGKELVARLIHALDPRADKGEMVVLDCTTVIPALAGSEFFGHERGAFTGAMTARDGAFALANGGTLFLDEVGELPALLQAQLLRVVQEKTFKRVGGNTWHETSFRLICATNRNLEAEVAQGSFRSDFFHRIVHSRCRLPALRDRDNDVLLLAAHFFAAHRPNEEFLGFDPVVERFLRQRAYPGNVRELKHLVNRICDCHVGEAPISIGDIPPEDLPVGEPALDWPGEAIEALVAKALSLGIGLKEIGRITSEAAIRLALESEGGNLQRAAKLLKVTDRALQMRKAQGAA